MWSRCLSSTSNNGASGKKWDAVIIGGGHNGLSVAVLERRHLIGGAAVTEELIPGFKFSPCSYLQSLLRPSIIRYENQLLKFCKFLDFLLDSPTAESLHSDHSSFAERMKDKLQKSAFWSRCEKLCPWDKRTWDFMDLLLSPSSKVLNNWFEVGDVLKATLATDAVGSMASVHTPGSGYVLLHHVMGETDEHRGVWSYVEGGMGSVSSAISNAAKEAGAHIITNAEV
ncbi:hypothetical protein MKX01_015986 [Papaver californicum]|nr:hypothetical protein MKX01_015986 [Papaver californicum]